MAKLTSGKFDELLMDGLEWEELIVLEALVRKFGRFGNDVVFWWCRIVWVGGVWMDPFLFYMSLS